MTYIPKYTTIDNISRKLIGRLNISSADSLPIFPTSTPTQQVDPILIDQVLKEQESYLDSILGMIYELPLQNQHNILTTLVDSLVISELILIHYQGIQFGLGADLSGYGNTHTNKANTLLNQITAGYNIIIPMMQPVPPNYPGYVPQRRLELPGEVLRLIPPQQRLVNNEIYISKYDGADSLAELITDDNKDNPFSMDYEYRNN